MDKCKGCEKEIQDPNFNCEDCLKELAGDYNKTCPICRRKYDTSILTTNGHWHCSVCGELYYKKNDRKQVEKLLRIAQAREIIKNYVKIEYRKTHMPVNISSYIIQQILKEQGIIK